MTTAQQPITMDVSSLISALAEAARPELPKLMTAEEAAKALAICDKVFRREVRAKRIRYIMIGRRKKFTASDLQAYIDSQRGAVPCPSTARKAPRTTTTISSSRASGIMALRESMTSKKQRQ